MKRILLTIALVVCLQFAGAQEISLQEQSSPTDATASIEEKFAAYSQLLSPEKLYLHTDREVYCVGDTIWFKGYLKNSSQLSEFPESNYIYVELFSTMVKIQITNKLENKEELRSRVKIRRIDDTFTGYIKIPENLNTGVAVVRAYSYWMMNKEPEYMFSKNIELRNPMKDDFVKSLEEQKVYDRQKYFEIGAENPFKRFKDPKFDIDIQFMPESGRYVAGMNSVIAFKAIDQKGFGLKVHGAVYLNDKDSVTFESNALGMGTMNIKVDSVPKKITARVYHYDEFSKEVEFPLPEQQAVVMNIRQDTSMVVADIYSKNITTDTPLWFVVHDGTEIYVKAPYDLTGKRFKLEHKLLTPGINNAAIVDDNGNVYASRSFFIYPKYEAIATLNTDRAEYKGKEKVQCDIELKDANGNPLSGNFSLSVSDDIYTPYSGKGNNIVTHMLLSSEIKGLVEQPQVYFNTEKSLNERIQNMDILMLSQGWKYYDLPKILTNSTEIPRMGKEYTQSISGRVMGLFRMPKKAVVSLVAPAIGLSGMGQLDTSGWFEVNELDFPDSTHFIFSAGKPGGGGKLYTPQLDSIIYAAEHSYPKYLKHRAYTKEYKQAAMSEYYDAGGDMFYTLNPVYVTGRNTTKVRSNISPFPQHQFKSGQYRGEKDMAPYKDVDLLSYIRMTCPGIRTISGWAVSRVGGYISSRMQQTRMTYASIIVYINGVQVNQMDLDLSTIMVSELDAFVLINGLEAAKFETNMKLLLNTPRSVLLLGMK